MQPQSSVYVCMLIELCEGVVCWASVVRATHGVCESDAESELVWLPRMASSFQNEKAIRIIS